MRSGRRLTLQVPCDMLSRRFVGQSMDAPAREVTVFTRTRDRLLRGEMAGTFLAAVLADPRVTPLLPVEPFPAAGTLIEAWASMKGVRPRDGSGAPPGPGRDGERDFHDEKRPDARLAEGEACALRGFRLSVALAPDSGPN